VGTQPSRTRDTADRLGESEHRAEISVGREPRSLKKPARSYSALWGAILY